MPPPSRSPNSISARASLSELKAQRDRAAAASISAQKVLGLKSGDKVEIRDLPNSPWLPGVVMKVANDGRPRVRRDQDRLSKTDGVFFREVRRAAVAKKNDENNRNATAVRAIPRESDEIKSLKAMVRALPESERALSPLFGRLADAYQKSGDMDSARALFTEIVRTRRRFLGNFHPNTLAAVDNLGMLLADMGDLQSARPYFEESLKGLRQTYGSLSINTLTACDNLAQLQDGLYEVNEAEALYEEALAGYRKVLGEDHPQTLMCMYNLGLLLQNMGDFQGALPLFHEEFTRTKKKHGPSHQETIGSAKNLIRVLIEVGDSAGAAKIGKELHFGVTM